MTVIRVPFHGSDRLDDASAPLPPGTPSVLVDPVLPDGDRWARLIADVLALVPGTTGA